MRRGAAALVAAAVTGIAALAPAATGADAPRKPAARAAQSAIALSPYEQRLIELVDTYRRSLGLSGLRVYRTLLDEARWYAQDMAFNDSFSVTHIDSLGRTIDQRFWDFGYPIVRPLGQSTSSGKLTPEATFEQMRTSRLHDEIMRDPRFRLVGAGYGYNESTDSKAFWVLSFARDDPAELAAKRKAARKKAAKKSKASRARKAAKQRKAARARKSAPRR